MFSHTNNGLQFAAKALTLMAGLALLATSAQAATYDESVSGDLSDNPATPQTLTLALGTNSILGTLGNGAGTDNLDVIAFTVPAGMVLSGFTNSVYFGSNSQDFIGFQPGSSFVGSTSVSANYAGLAHFGLFATNAGVGTPPGTPTSTVGLDLLPVMNTEGLAVGATGFSLPLGPGTYTFVLGMLTASLTEFPTYRFDATVTPEPGGLLFATIGAIGLMWSGRTGSRRRRT